MLVLQYETRQQFHNGQHIRNKSKICEIVRQSGFYFELLEYLQFSLTIIYERVYIIS